MSDFIDKRRRAVLFRDRLAAAMAGAGLSQSALARAIGVDRSTVSQLLAEGTARLPNAHLVGASAAALGVSSDWLLGLSDRPESAADLLAISLSMPEAPRALVDEQVLAWHREAAGYKIRHVPASLPDMLKTRAMLEWEYAAHLGRTAEQAIGASQDRLAWMRGLRSDYEIALPRHEMESFARAEGYYAGLPAELRRDQIDRLLNLHAQLYPTLRLTLFDAREVYSAPLTVFGPLLAALYVGHYYLAFRDSERVRLFTRHFDALVRAAQVSDRALPDFLHGLRAGVA
ncbi:transcriptional regulator with XRE-family HTH domain [Rhodovulum iodosum]|uniref:Transcriptional regulator with XRE-family HTH domain n=1 Tax=Rhodovulum iodosum TaxID=68291 RepID=A0ABV3XQ30_9RHOB|nr:helix-turn-helix transcriptional regulator [Rhodovulum robiginosum]RSK31540.1 XRE family transcriptional regulator [Rhodovulum robiginosum]